MEPYFEFELTLEKAVSHDGRLLVSGVASTTSTDFQNDAFSENALHSMAAQALGKPFVTSHNHELGDEIGTITKAKVDGNQLWIEGELDADDVLAQRLHKKILKSGKAGFSVGAYLLAVKPGLSKSVRVIDDVKLNHVMLTNKPVQKDTFCVAISKALHQYGESNIMENQEVAVEQTEEIAKAGMKFSSDTLAQLKTIHDSAPDEATKGNIRDMVGAQVDETYWSPAEVESPVEEASEAGKSDTPDDAHVPEVAEVIQADSSAAEANDKFVGVINKSIDDRLAPKLAELNEAIALLKSLSSTMTQGRGHDASASAPVPTVSASELRKAHRNDSDLIAHMLLKASNGG